MPRPGEPGIIPGIEITEVLGRGPQTVVYRACRGSRLLAVKMLRPASPELVSSLKGRFRRRALWFAGVGHGCLAPIEEVGESTDGLPYAASPFIEGPRIAALSKRGALPGKDVLSIARALAGTLNALHGRGLVHGGVLPRNIVVQRNGAVQLLDPDILGIEPSMAAEPLGDLMYDAPERLGLIEHPLDGRADLYSLGAVLFHAATGRPPFRAGHPSDLLRQRSSETPPPAHEVSPSLSHAFSAILDKLITKDIDHRYQSSEDLLVDLGKLEGLEELAREHRPLQLDSGAPAVTSLEPVPFIDRMQQLERLLGKLSKLEKGEGTVTILESAPGGGKTRLAKELERAATRKRRLVLKAQCIENETAPYIELRRALDGWVKAEKNSPNGEHISPRQALIDAGTRFAPYLTRFWPELADILPAVTNTPLVPGGNQVSSSAADLLVRLTERVGPILLVVEDFQWVSPSTARVLAALAPKLGKTPLMLVLTGRAPDIHTETALFLQRRLRCAGSMRLHLPPLEEPSSRAFIRDMLGTLQVSEELMADLVACSRGNPLRLRESVFALLDSMTISLEGGRWAAKGALEVRRVIKKSQKRLLLERFGVLSSPTREVLATAAVAGHIFCPEVLTKALGKTRAETNLCISDAMQAGLIVRWPPFGYAASHEQIREALRLCFDEEEKRLTHLRIATAIEARRDLHLSDCSAAFHYASAGPEAPAKKILSTNFSAGCAAMRARAHQEAIPYLQAAHDACGRLDKPPHRLDVTLEEALGEAYYQTGLAQAARRHFEAVLRLSSKPPQRARTHGRLSDLHLMDLSSTDASSELEKGLRALGERPTKGAATARSLFGASIGRLLVFSRATGRRRRRGANAHRDRLLIDLYLRAAQVGYLSMRPDLLSKMRLSALRPAARLGLSREQLFLLSHQNLLLSTLSTRLPRPPKGWPPRKDSRDSLDDPAALAQVQALEARSASQLGDPLRSEALARHVIDELGPWLDTREYVFTVGDLLWGLMTRGRMIEAWELVQKIFLEVSPRTLRPPVAVHSLPHTAAMACLSVLGRFRPARFHREQAGATMAAKTDPFWRAMFLTASLLFYREQRELGHPSEEVLTEFRRLDLAPGRLPMYLRLFLVVQAYVRIDQFAGGAGGTKESRERLAVAVRDLEAAASTPLIRGHAKVARAAFLRLWGRHDKASKLLDQAESMGDSLDAPWIVYEACCERARLLHALDKPSAARRTATSALAIARRNGWRPRARRLRIEFQLETPKRRARNGGAAGHDGFTQALEMVLWTTHSPSPAVQVRLVLDLLIRLLGGERAILLHHDERADMLRLVAGRDLRGNDVDYVEPDSLELCMQTIKTGRPLSSQTSAKAPPAHLDGHRREAAHVVRALTAPLIRNRRVSAVLLLERKSETGSLETADLEMLAAIARHVPLVLDISDEARLEVYERIATNLPGLIFQFVRHQDGRRAYRFVSSNVRQLGVTPEEVRRDAGALLDRIHRDDRPRFEHSIEHSARSLTQWRWQGRYVLPDGGIKWFLGLARPEKQPGGEILWDGLIVDITRLKRAEERSRALAAQLEDKVAARTEELALANRELEAFTYSVSHDLRSPLLTIQGYAEELSALISEDGSEEAKEFLAKIQGSAAKMETLIEAMLCLSRIAHQPLVRKEVDLSGMAHEVLESLHRLEPHRKVVISIEPGLKAVADETLARVLMENLLRNAWKFARGNEIAHIGFFRSKKDGLEIFTVEDDGAGFEMELAQQIFQPFRRLHERDEYEGSGIGLSTVRRVVQRHGGRIWAEGAPGEGARLHFHLEPRAKERWEHQAPKE